MVCSIFTSWEQKSTAGFAVGASIMFRTSRKLGYIDTIGPEAREQASSQGGETQVPFSGQFLGEAMLKSSHFEKVRQVLKGSSMSKDLFRESQPKFDSNT